MAFSNTIYLNLLLSFYGSCFWVTKSNLSWIVMGNVPLFFLGFYETGFHHDCYVSMGLIATGVCLSIRHHYLLTHLFCNIAPKKFLLTQFFIK